MPGALGGTQRSSEAPRRRALDLLDHLADLDEFVVGRAPLVELGPQPRTLGVGFAELRLGVAQPLLEIGIAHRSSAIRGAARANTTKPTVKIPTTNAAANATWPHPAIATAPGVVGSISA